MDVLPASDIFSYPNFTNGKVFLRGNTKAEAKLNYNRLVDEMHFIDAKGDTLALDNEKNIQFIVIANDTFYYDEGYVRLLSTGNFLKLAIRQVWLITDTRQVGAYNTTNNSVAMISLTDVNERGRLYDLTVHEDVILTKVETYYFGDNYNHFVSANKANLLMLFPKEERRIGKYLKENKVNFNNKEDIEKLVQFLEHL